MGTVGISFGSPTSGQGFDVQSTVNSIIANMSAIETPWQNQLTSLQAQDTALTTIGTDLSSLASALETLQSDLTQKTGQSSDESVLTLNSTDSSAVAGNHTVVVNQLAQTATYASSAIASGDTLQGTLTINGQSITIDSSDDTLATLASTINSNSSTYGVTANVVPTSTGDVLSLVSNTSGAGGDVTIGGGLTDQSNSGSSITFTQTQKGQDAELTVDNVSGITSSSNTVTNAIAGVTMQLLEASAPGTSVQVVIANNNSQIETDMSSFVKAYNTVMGDLDTQEGNDSSGNPEPLFGNPLIATIQEQLQQALNFTQSNGAITSATQLGIGVNANQASASSSEGLIALDGGTLDSALTNNFQAVLNFFQPGNGFTSFGDNLSSILSSLGNTPPDSGIGTDATNAAGDIFLQLQQDASVEKSLNTNITNENTLLATEQTQLTTELNQANFVLQEIPQQLQAVNEMYSAITGFNENPQG